MATEWVPSLVTGVVGVAGIAGTLLTVRYQRKERMDALANERAYQIQDTLRQERKQSYATFLDLADELIQLYQRLGTFERGRREHGRSSDALDKEISQLREQEEDLNRALRSAATALDLVAPVNVMQYAGFFRHAVFQYQIWSMEPRLGGGIEGVAERIANLDKVGQEAIKTRMNLIEAMRWDLTEIEDHLAQAGYVAGRSGQMYPHFVSPDERADPPVPGRAD